MSNTKWKEIYTFNSKIKKICEEKNAKFKCTKNKTKIDNPKELVVGNLYSSSLLGGESYYPFNV